MPFNKQCIDVESQHNIFDFSDFVIDMRLCGHQYFFKQIR